MSGPRVGGTLGEGEDGRTRSVRSRGGPQES